MDKVLDCELKVSKFKLQLHYYVHFQTNILGKVWTPYTTSYGLDSITGIPQWG